MPKCPHIPIIHGLTFEVIARIILNKLALEILVLFITQFCGYIQ